jgi:hypothetical protein
MAFSLGGIVQAAQRSIQAVVAPVTKTVSTAVSTVAQAIIAPTQIAKAVITAAPTVVSAVPTVISAATKAPVTPTIILPQPPKMTPAITPAITPALVSREKSRITKAVSTAVSTVGQAITPAIQPTQALLIQVPKTSTGDMMAVPLAAIGAGIEAIGAVAGAVGAVTRKSNVVAVGRKYIVRQRADGTLTVSSRMPRRRYYGRRGTQMDKLMQLAVMSSLLRGR